jgi:hypothetical protein
MDYREGLNLSWELSCWHVILAELFPEIGLTGTVFGKNRWAKKAGEGTGDGFENRARRWILSV